MHYILYLSVASGYLDDEELKTILSKSRPKNQKQGITGVLLYGNGRFIQMLEGERENVEKTFERIKVDRRHLDVTVIAWGNLEKRCFPEWFMGFKAISSYASSDLNGFWDLTQKPLNKDECELPIKLLQSFVRKNRLDTD